MKKKAMPCEVIITPFAEKQLKRVPVHLKEHVLYWAHSVERQGILEVRKLPGYHDEPLKGGPPGATVHKTKSVIPIDI